MAGMNAIINDIMLTIKIIHLCCFSLYRWFPSPSLCIVSYNSTLIHTQVNSSMTSYTVSSVPGVTYYITVFAVNALGPGPINGYSIVNGEKKNTLCDYHEVIYSVPLLPTITSTQCSTNTII